MKILPNKISIRLIILSSTLFVLILFCIQIYFQQNTKTPSTSTSPTISTPGTTSTPITTSIPSPAPVIQPFAGSRQNILITIPKYLDISDEKETYEVSFDEVSANSGFYLTNKTFPSLVILDENYKFSVVLTKEVVGDLEESKKVFTQVNTNQFGTLKKVIRDSDADNGVTYGYFTDNYAVNLFPQNQDSSSYAYMTCHILGEDLGECDKLISTLSIKLK